jgi:hypothetical protein
MHGGAKGSGGPPALETARLEVIEQLAKSPNPLTGGDLQLLATIHTALGAVREEVQAHGIGWGRQGHLGLATVGREGRHNAGAT